MDRILTHSSCFTKSGPEPTFAWNTQRGGGSGPTAVPVENTGRPGTRNAHWRETIFLNELMSGFIAEIGNPLSRMTVGSLQDLGYIVNIDAAEAYKY